MVNRIETSISWAFREAWLGSLKDLVQEQKQETNKKQILPLSGNRKEILRAYEKCETFKALYQEALLEMLIPRTDEEIKQIKRDFAGRAYEGIAFRYLLGKQRGTETLLSPERTLKFFNTLYPNAQTLRISLSPPFLESTWVPDGLIVKDNPQQGLSIVKVCEYTLTGHPHYFSKKEQSFEGVRKSFRGLFKSTGLIFVIPKGAMSPHSLSRKVERVSLVFSREQFSHFVSKVFNYYREDEEDATLMEIQRRIKDQQKRYVSVKLSSKDNNSSIKKIPNCF